MQSIFKPESSQYDKTAIQIAYATIVKRMSIDPITEGRILEEKIQNELFGNDLLKLKSQDERTNRLALVNRWTDIYGKRAKRFWTVFQSYLYARGQMRALTTLSSFLKDSDIRAKQIETNVKNLFEKDKRKKS